MSPYIPDPKPHYFCFPEPNFVPDICISFQKYVNASIIKYTHITLFFPPCMSIAQRALHIHHGQLFILIAPWIPLTLRVSEEQWLVVDPVPRLPACRLNLLLRNPFFKLINLQVPQFFSSVTEIKMDCCEIKCCNSKDLFSTMLDRQ